MPNVMAALPNVGGALCSSPQSLADAQYWNTCSNAAKTQNQLKFAGVPQTRQQISAASGPKFTILCGHVEEILLLNKFFRIVNTCLSGEDIARQSCGMVLRWRTAQHSVSLNPIRILHVPAFSHCKAVIGLATQCGLGWGLPSYQVASWSIQPSGHNRHGPKSGRRGCVPLLRQSKLSIPTVLPYGGITRMAYCLCKSVKNCVRVIRVRLGLVVDVHYSGCLLLTPIYCVISLCWLKIMEKPLLCESVKLQCYQ